MSAYPSFMALSKSRYLADAARACCSCHMVDPESPVYCNTTFPSGFTAFELCCSASETVESKDAFLQPDIKNADNRTVKTAYMIVCFEAKEFLVARNAPLIKFFIFNFLKS